MSRLKEVRDMVQPPAWLDDLVNLAAAQLHPMDILSPLGCHFHRADSAWEVTLFASRTEVVGGRRDGELRSSRFHVDLRSLVEMFDEVKSFHWQAHGMGPRDELGPHVAIEGLFRGEAVWLRIPSTAPARFEPGRQAVVHEQSWEEVW